MCPTICPSVIFTPLSASVPMHSFMKRMRSWMLNVVDELVNDKCKSAWKHYVPTCLKRLAFQSIFHWFKDITSVLGQKTEPSKKLTDVKGINIERCERFVLIGSYQILCCLIWLRIIRIISLRIYGYSFIFLLVHTPSKLSPLPTLVVTLIIFCLICFR